VAVALLALLGHLARDRHVLVAIDDVQWLDASSRDVLLFALRRLESLRVSLFGATRQDGRLQTPGLEILLVEPLSLDSLDRLLRARLELHLSRPALARLERTTGGNAFYALELGRALRTRGGPDVDGFGPVPDDVRSLLRQRLRALPQAAEEAALVAATLARPTRELVERVAPAEGLEAAITAGILERRDGGLAFAHPLLASVLVADAAASDVRRLHALLADVVNDTQERARHLAAAAVGPDEAVADEVERAAVAARQRGAVIDAAELSERALALTEASRRSNRVRRALLAAQHQFDAGDAHRSAEILEAVRVSAKRGSELARVLLQLGQARGEADDPAAALELFDEALAMPGLSTDLEARLFLSRAGYAGTLGRWDDAVESAGAAVPRARAAGLRGVLAQALALRAFSGFCLGHGDDGEAFHEAVELERAGAEVWWDWSPRLLLATHLNWTGRNDEGCALFEEVLEDVRAAADPSLAAVLQQFADNLMHSGDIARAEAHVREGLEAAERDGRDAVAAVFLYQLATIASIRGDADETRRLAVEGIARANATGQTRHVHSIAAAVADLEVSLGRHEAALDALESSLREWKETPGPFPIFRTVPLAAQALVALGRPQEARAVAATWLQAVFASPTPDTLPLAHWTVGVLAAAEGADEEADDALGAAVAAGRSVGMPYPLARILLARGAFLRHRRQWRDARAALEESRALFERLGAAIWARQAAEELERVGGRRVMPGKLTPTELRIAQLVARGRSNHEVARELFISPKTVEWNLSKVYRKLMVRSRTELAAKLTRRAG